MSFCHGWPFSQDWRDEGHESKGDSPEKRLKLKGYSVAKQKKLQYLKNGKHYGVALATIVFMSLLTWLVYPGSSQAEQSVVFLRNTLPVETPVVTDFVTDVAEELYAEEDAVELHPDQELIEMLKMNDSQIAYEKLDDQESWHVVHMRVTGYCSCPKCCGKFSDGKTASNRKIRQGDVFVAADKQYRFGTEMIIPGYNAVPVWFLFRIARSRHQRQSFGPIF